MQNFLELIRSRPPCDLRLLLNKVEVLLVPDIARIIKKRYENQTLLVGLEMAEVHASRQNMFRNAS